MAAATGNLSTFVLTGTTLSGAARIIGGHTEEVAKIEIQDLALTGYKNYIPGDLKEPGEFDVELEFDVAAVPSAIGGTANTCTIAFKGSGTDDIVGSAFVTAIKYPDHQNEELMIYTLTVAFDGVTGPTYSTA